MMQHAPKCFPSYARFARELKLGPVRTASLFNISDNLLRACEGERDRAEAAGHYVSFVCSLGTPAMPQSCIHKHIASHIGSAHSSPSYLQSTAGASLADAESTIKADLLGICRAKPGEDSPYMSPEQVMSKGQPGRPG